jgi:molecular chaperone GrpE (heat shock protein)
MGINILKEISERARKIEYINTESNRDLDFKDLFNDSEGEKGIRDPKIDDISRGVGAILEKMNNDSQKKTQEPSNEFDIMFKSILSIYDYIYDKKESLGPEKVEASMVIEDILKKFENDLKKSGVVLQNPLNKQYDSDLHDKAGNDKNPEIEENTITKVIKCGVIYRDQIIRRAKVVVIQNKRKSKDK